jgi:hypothetical protein
MDNRLQLGDFLRRRRAELSPADVGLPADGPRRTPGLRRDEVAALAYISAVYYQRKRAGVKSDGMDFLYLAFWRVLRFC